MKPQALGMQRTFALVVLTIALAAMASQPIVAADRVVAEQTGGIAPAFVGFWAGPGAQVLIVVVAVPDEVPEPAVDEDGDKNGVILEDGAPF